LAAGGFDLDADGAGARLDALTIDHVSSTPANREADRPARLVPNTVIIMNARPISNIAASPNASAPLRARRGLPERSDDSGKCPGNEAGGPVCFFDGIAGPSYLDYYCPIV